VRKIAKIAGIAKIAKIEDQALALINQMNWIEGCQNEEYRTH
jgi:hypothetical protein